MSIELSLLSYLSVVYAVIVNVVYLLSKIEGIRTADKQRRRNG